MLDASSTLRSQETWLPICLPRFNAEGFVHAYVSYVVEDIGLVFVSANKDAFEELREWKVTVMEVCASVKRSGQTEPLPEIGRRRSTEPDRTVDCAASLLHLWVSRYFFIPESAELSATLGVIGLRHFLYKSRQHVQITSPVWDNLYAEDGAARKR